MFKYGGIDQLFSKSSLFTPELNAFFSHQNLLLKKFLQSVLKTNQLMKTWDETNSNISNCEICVESLACTVETRAKQTCLKDSLTDLVCVSYCHMSSNVLDVRFLRDCARGPRFVEDRCSMLPWGPGALPCLAEPMAPPEAVSGRSSSAASLINSVFLEVYCLSWRLCSVTK